MQNKSVMKFLENKIAMANDKGMQPIHISADHDGSSLMQIMMVAHSCSHWQQAQIRIPFIC